MRVAVADGLGHGHEAAAAARLAMTAPEAEPDQSPPRLLERCHRAPRGMRGVVMGLASLDAPDRSMTWIAVGNLAAVLVRTDKSGAAAKAHVIRRGGIVGLQTSPRRPAAVPIQADGGDAG